MTKHQPRPGSISTGTLLTEDLLSAFAYELEWIGEDEDKALIAEAHAMLEADDFGQDEWQDEAAELVDDLTDALNERAPPYCYFGAHAGDGADFGFWPSWDSIDELPKFNDLADVPADIADDYVIVSDHGNVTLYSADGREIWGVV
jgi:hypothetical protein